MKIFWCEKCGLLRHFGGAGSVQFAHFPALALRKPIPCPYLLNKCSVPSAATISGDMQHTPLCAQFSLYNYFVLYSYSIYLPVYFDGFICLPDAIYSMANTGEPDGKACDKVHLSFAKTNDGCRPRRWCIVCALRCSTAQNSSWKERLPRGDARFKPRLFYCRVVCLTAFCFYLFHVFLFHHPDPNYNYSHNQCTIPIIVVHTTCYELRAYYTMYTNSEKDGALNQSIIWRLKREVFASLRRDGLMFGCMRERRE